MSWFSGLGLAVGCCNWDVVGIVSDFSSLPKDMGKETMRLSGTELCKDRVRMSLGKIAGCV